MKYSVKNFVRGIDKLPDKDFQNVMGFIGAVVVVMVLLWSAIAFALSYSGAVAAQGAASAPLQEN